MPGAGSRPVSSVRSPPNSWRPCSGSWRHRHDCRSSLAEWSRPDAFTPAVVAGSARSVVMAYVGLMKTRIIELLLLTTVPVMFLATRAVPALALVVATVLAGTLSAGSANALNCCRGRRHRPADATYPTTTLAAAQGLSATGAGVRPGPGGGVDVSAGSHGELAVSLAGARARTCSTSWVIRSSSSGVPRNTWHCFLLRSQWPRLPDTQPLVGPNSQGYGVGPGATWVQGADR